MTKALIQITHWITDVAGPFLVLGIPLLVGVIIYVQLKPRRPDRPRLVSRLVDHIRWHMPGFGRLTQAQNLGMTASLLRLLIGTGMPLDRATRLAAETDMNIILRRRLERFADLISAGTVPAQAAQQVELGNVFTIALRNGQYGNQLDTSLKYAAEYYNNLTSRLWIVLRNLSWPVPVIVMALLVGLFVLALFLPLVTLINAVTGPM